MITTFYSYKGGVGRSMALANVANRLARRGLRVLMIDFDLEAPGLERFFPVESGLVRANPGLLDLLLAYKEAMAQPPGQEAREFTKLERFVVPIYQRLPAGGHLDLLPAGSRAGEEQLAAYAYQLRTFDWQNFFFEWAGELFFQWLRRELGSRYDTVLVDSRTGVTEMGGVCAYQLADSLVMLCAPNSQNIEGTRDVIQNFNTERVRNLRKDRPLQLLVIPARVQPNSRELANFRHEFNLFDANLPEAFKSRGISFWQLLIPYDPDFAFSERIAPTDSPDSKLSEAFGSLAGALGLLAVRDSKFARATEDWLSTKETPQTIKDRGNLPSTQRLPEARYDATTPFAGYDAFLSYHERDAHFAAELASRLTTAGKRIYWRGARTESSPGLTAELRALRESGAAVVLIGPELQASQLDEIDIAVARAEEIENWQVVPVLVPGATVDSLPRRLAAFPPVDVRSALGSKEVAAIVEALDPGMKRRREVLRSEENPFPGLLAFDEAYAPFYFRDRVVSTALARLEHSSFLAIVGESGSGKSSLVRAGLLPALRATTAGARFIVMRPTHRPIEALAEALAIDSDGLPAEQLRARLLNHATLLDALPWSGPTILIIDQLEELFTIPLYDDERRRFLGLLASAIDSASERLCIITTLRSDFFNQVMRAEEKLGFALSANSLFLQPMNNEELREVIEKPCIAAGIAFEPGLVDRILTDVSSAATPLPILQGLLQRLWLERRRGYITHVAYESMGGLRFLGEWCESIYATLSYEDQRAAHQLFLKLVSAQNKRTAISLQELTPAEQSVAKRLVDFRMLVIIATGDRAFVELAHEAITLEWPRLTTWLAEQRGRATEHKVSTTQSAQDGASFRVFDRLIEQLGLPVFKWLAEQLGRATETVKGRTAPKVFMSYRRDDCASFAGRLDDRLRAALGDDCVFRDIENISVGTDFRQQILQVLTDANVMLVLIGKRWLFDRLNSESDFVRIEIRAALERDIPVIPILVDGGQMPGLNELPADLVPLAQRQALLMDSGRDFDSRFNQLVKSITSLTVRETSKGRQASRVRDRLSASPNQRAVQAQTSVAAPTSLSFVVTVVVVAIVIALTWLLARRQ